MKRRLASATVLLAALAVTATTAAAPSTCVGAAARDPHRTCVDDSRTISPRTGDPALRRSALDCQPARRRPGLVCAFGAPARGARATVALVGDSHAEHWRAAIDVVARAKRWHGLSITMAACPFSAPVTLLYVGPRCLRWYAETHAWFAHHPKVSTVFISQEANPRVAAAGLTAALAAAYVHAWSTLPTTVKRIVVLRDVPDPLDDTLGCLDEALAPGMPPLAVACPTLRRTALVPDPAAIAARSLHSKRYRVIDLTSLFCEPVNCFPVIGGVQVYADIVGHITVAYMRTVAPYLLRRLGG